jgi:hypothetical protein
MRDSDLNAFLASVRRTRFVDYLDPLGETAQNAFERRLSWARVSQHDPAYADEARFLLDNAETLRDVLRRELEEDDWIEEADVGREWETRPSRAVRMRENDRVTEIFQADDIEIGASGSRPSRGRGNAVHQVRQDPSYGAGRATRSTPPQSSPSARRGASPSGRGGPPPEDRLVDGRIGRGTPDLVEGPRRNPGERRSIGRSAEVARRADPGSDLVQSDLGRRGRDTGSPPPRRSSGRSSGRIGSPGGIGAAGNSLPPVEERPRQRDRALDLIGRSNPGSPAPSNLGRWQAPVRAEVSLDEDEATTPMPRMSDAPAPVQMTAARSGRSGHDVPIQEVDLEDWESPDDPVSSTGIMRIEDVTSPPMSQQVVIGVDNLETLVRPSPVVTSSVVMDDAATRPSAATRLRRPDPESRMGGAGPLARSSLRSMPPPRRRSRIPMLAMGLFGMMGLAALVGGAIALPVLYTQTDGFTSFDLAEIVGDPVVANPEPEVERAPEPPSPEPGAEGADDPGDAQAAGAEGEGAVAVAAVGGGSPPAGATPPAPEPRAKVETPQPKVESKAPPAPEPASTLPPIDLQGLWVGSTKPNDKSLKVTVLGQTDGMFEGTVDMQNDEGLFDSFAIQGKVDGGGVLTFRGNGVTFTGRVDPSGQRATGTYSLRPGGPSSQWSAVHPN